MRTETARQRRAAVAAAAASAIALGLAGCTVGPDFHRPDPHAPPDWSIPASEAASGAGSHAVGQPFDGTRWWAVFHDATLDALVDEARRQSLDLQTAAARIQEARAQRDAAAGAALPTVGGTGVAGRTRMSENGIASALGAGGSATEGVGGAGAAANAGGNAPSTTTNLFQAGFDASWELDLWGKTRRNVEAATAAVESAEESRGEASVSLTAEVARTYLGLRGLQRELAVQRADIAGQERLLRLVESSAHNGLAPRSDVAQQATQVATSRAQLPPLVQNLALAESRLAWLLALPPGALHQRLEGATTVAPMLPPEVPVGLPGDLLRRRPDVRRSEAALHAATARVGVAEAQRFPSIQLGASAGFQATRLADLNDWASRFVLGGAEISVPLFQGGRLQAQQHAADAQLQEAAIAYRQAVLSAYHDADNALLSYAQEQRHASALADQLAAARRGRELAQNRYRSGLAALTEVLQADHAARESELAMLQSTVAEETDLVALFKALGGDWATPGLADGNAMNR